MSASFYFYDLETSGFSPKDARIMQFGGQRTDMDLKPIGEPHNYLIRLSEDILPDPDALLVTGITPQKTISEGISEAEFIKIFNEEISTPGTIFVGYNNVRFDDEFMRYLNYRNFNDPYEWQWKDDRSRWDMLDVVRMMRALRPEGIQWPFASDGKPSNRLELLTSLNKISHDGAHDALADVLAVIDLAKMIKAKQPKLFDYLLNIRDKKKVAMLANSGQLFLYTSGRYSSEYEKTALVGNIADYSKRQGAIVYDLRYDPAQFMKMSDAQLAEALTWSKDPEKLRLPVKILKFNKCPAVAPLSVLDKASAGRLQIDVKQSQQNYQTIMDSDLPARILKVMESMETLRQASFIEDNREVDGQLYDGFFDDSDKQVINSVRTTDSDHLKNLQPDFRDSRLQAMFPLYKARNFPKTMSEEDRDIWTAHCYRKLMEGKTESRAAKFFKRLEELQAQSGLSDNQRFLLEELSLYAESILPIEPV